MTPRPLRWPSVVAVLHWVNAALILALLAIGWAMNHRIFGAATTFEVYQWHKSLGFAALLLTAIRLAARAIFPAPEPMPGFDGRLARAVQASFYVLTLIAIGAGWLVVSASPLPVPTRFFGLFVIPNVAPPDAALFGWSGLAHRLAAYAIAALVALHVAGALKHQFVGRDDALGRMLPQRRNTLPAAGGPDFRRPSRS